MLEPLEFQPFAWSNDAFEDIRKNKARLARRAEPGNARSPAIQRALDTLKNNLEAGIRDGHLLLQSPMDCRALAYLIAYDEHWSIELELSDTLLARIIEVSEKLNRQSLLMFVLAFFEQFDRLAGGEDAVNRLGEFIKQQLMELEISSRHSSLSELAQHSESVLTDSGPQNLIDWAQSNAQELDQAYTKFGIAHYAGGRFKEVCTHRYYIEQLSRIDIGTNHPVLEEIIQPAVYDAVLSNGRRLGHRILEILIDRTAKANDSMSDDWMKVVFAIAGDPRVPDTSSNYMKWWADLGLQRIASMRGWLSSLDLRLFLEVLEDYGRSANDHALMRMYPARKRFLEGLIEQNLVQNSRLFINRGAESFLLSNFEKEGLPEYAVVRDGASRSMIYLQVGDLHMVEGSHNCTLRIFPSLPTQTQILDYGIKYYTTEQLGTQLQIQYSNETEFVGREAASIRHDPNNFNWQRQAIRYLNQNGLQLDIEKLFSNSDYAEYIRLRGY